MCCHSLEVCTGERDLELGAEDAERRLQVVRGVGDELALTLLCGLEACQQVVHRDGQTGHLVAGGRHLDACAQGARVQPGHLPAYVLDRAQRTPDGQPDGQRQQGHEQGQPVDQAGDQLISCLLAGLEARADENRDLAVSGVGASGPDPVVLGLVVVRQPPHRARLGTLADLAWDRDRRPAGDVRRCGDHPSVPVDDLGEGVVADPVDHRGEGAEPGLVEKLGEARLGALVGRGRQGVVERPDEQHRSREQGQRHHDRRRHGGAGPDGGESPESVHGLGSSASSRYPAPRTVCRLARPNGWSMRLRRLAT